MSLLVCAPRAKAASPTFTSFATNDFTVVTNTAPWTIFANYSHVVVTNSLVIGNWGLVITNANAYGIPAWTNTLWINSITSQMWFWDAPNTVWVAISPSVSSGLYAVPTVVELRMLEDNGFLTWATTHGNVSPTDGQGRRYWWNASDTSADDGIAVIKPDTIDALDPGRWNEE